MSMASMWDNVQMESEGFGAGINYALSMGWFIVEKGTFLPRVQLTSAGYHRSHQLRKRELRYHPSAREF